MGESVNFSALYFYLVFILIAILLLIFVDPYDKYNDVYRGYMLLIELPLFLIFFSIISSCCIQRSYTAAWVVVILAIFVVPFIVGSLIRLSVRSAGLDNIYGVPIYPVNPIKDEMI